MVVGQQGGGLFVIGPEANLEAFGIVVGTAGLRIAGGDPFHQSLVVNLESDDQVNLGAAAGEHGVERLSLGQGPREAVEDRAAGLLGLWQALLDQGDDDLIGDQLAPLHDALDALAKLGARADGRAQHVAGGELDHALLTHQPLGLGALPRRRRSEQNQVHFEIPSPTGLKWRGVWRAALL